MQPWHWFQVRGQQPSVQCWDSLSQLFLLRRMIPLPQNKMPSTSFWNIPFLSCFVVHPNLCILWSLVSSVYPHSPPYTLPMCCFSCTSWKRRLMLFDSILPFYHLLVLSLNIFFPKWNMWEKIMPPKNRNSILSCYPIQDCSYEVLVS